MPHVQMSAAQLEVEYPSLEAVEDLDLPDLSRLEDEQLYAAGMRVVHDILHEMSEVGRTRRQGGTTDSKKSRQPVQPRVSKDDGLPREENLGAEETWRRSVGAPSGAFIVKRQAPRPHVGADAAMEPGGSWMEAARPFHERGRLADASRAHRNTGGSGSGSRAPGDSYQDRSHNLGHGSWHLPRCGKDGFNRGGAGKSFVHNSLVRGSHTVTEAPARGSTESATEPSQVKLSYPESGSCISLCGFSRFPCRRATDGAHALPDQVSAAQVGHL